MNQLCDSTAGECAYFSSAAATFYINY